MLTNISSSMSSNLFLHLSDIHFGQERGGRVHIHNDVKERLIDDIHQITNGEVKHKLAGIIISGDIAYAGVQGEYQEAGKWLDRVSSAAGCKTTDVYVVPGNHDIDRDRISGSAGLMLAEIQKDGDVALDKYLDNDTDCEVLYDRLAAYRSFAEGYGCPLDLSGGHAGNTFNFRLNDEINVRFLGLNSALACSSTDEMGNLILGAKQRVLVEKPNELLIVICHHPLNWFNDGDDAWKYLRRSASVFISGHEHSPSVKLESDDGHSDILMIAAGATVPPKAEGTYNFSYNILGFGWREEEGCLEVAINPRCWNDEKKIFGPDEEQIEHRKENYLVKQNKVCTDSSVARIPQENEPEVQLTVDSRTESTPLEMVNIAASIKLKFFRDLSADQRRMLLIEEGVLPNDWAGVLTHSVETLLFSQLLTKHDKAELEKKIITKINDAGVSE